MGWLVVGGGRAGGEPRACEVTRRQTSGRPGSQGRKWSFRCGRCPSTPEKTSEQWSCRASRSARRVGSARLRGRGSRGLCRVCVCVWRKRGQQQLHGWSSTPHGAWPPPTNERRRTAGIQNVRLGAAAIWLPLAIELLVRHGEHSGGQGADASTGESVAIGNANRAERRRSRRCEGMDREEAETGGGRGGGSEMRQAQGAAR